MTKGFENFWDDLKSFAGHWLTERFGSWPEEVICFNAMLPNPYGDE